MKRIQRKRTKGWRLPKTAKYVGCPTKFGNPFDWQDYKQDLKCSTELARQAAVKNYELWLSGEIGWYDTGHRDWILAHLDDLRGFDLACWCKLDQVCHVDVLLEMLETKDNEL